MATLTYDHDVFISYRREVNWTPWTRDNFRTLLASYLQQDLGYAPSIFVDERLEVGQEWVRELATHLAKSRVLVAVISGDYFTSPWCLHELDLMVERWTASGRPSPGIVIPVIAHDGDLIPDVVQRILHANVEKFRIACLNRTTPLYQEFSACIKEFSPALAKAIQAAPKFDSQWVAHHQQRFDEVFTHWNSGKTIIETKQFPLPVRPRPTKPPRLRTK